ncbi:MAG: hypothetical protein GEU71_15675, partial [Actinobacteria bacterium]|nr:hypothetical protein [Actinomycetota bacterium]
MPQPESTLVHFGLVTDSDHLQFRAERVTPGDVVQVLERLGAGPQFDRLSREGPVTFLQADYSGGLMTRPGIYPVDGVENNRPVGTMFSFNQGLQTRRPGLCILPEAVTNQASITSDEAISAFVAANKRQHQVVTAVGSSTGLIKYVGMGTKLYRVDRTTGAWSVAHTFTGTITAMAELVVNGDRVLVVARDDNVHYTTDPTATPTITFTELVGLTAGDRVDWMRYLPTLGPGTNVLSGQIGGTTNGIWYVKGSEAAPWTVGVVVNAQDADIDNPDTPLTTTGAISPLATAAADFFSGRISSSTGSRLLWGSLGNITGTGTTVGSMVTASVETTNAIGDQTGLAYGL